jgi:hypothetical protein
MSTEPSNNAAVTSHYKCIGSKPVHCSFYPSSCSFMHHSSTYTIYLPCISVFVMLKRIDLSRPLHCQPPRLEVVDVRSARNSPPDSSVLPALQ